MNTVPNAIANKDFISPREFAAVTRQLSIKVERIARAKLAEHGYIGLDPREDAPSTYDNLIQVYLTEHKLFPVFNGASDQTIYTNPAINLLARAWHDLLHIELEAPFTPEGEMLVAVEQVAVTENGSLVFDELEKNILIHEVVSQVAFEKEYGEFPVNQQQFIRDCLNYGLPAAKILSAKAQGLIAELA